MSRLISVASLLQRLQKARAEYCAAALDKADAENATFEYGLKVGYNRGLLAAEQHLEQMLKEEDDGRRPPDPTPPRRPYG